MPTIFSHVSSKKLEKSVTKVHRFESATRRCARKISAIDNPQKKINISDDNQLENDEEPSTSAFDTATVETEQQNEQQESEQQNEPPESEMQDMYVLEMYNLRKERDEALQRCKDLQDIISQIKLTARIVTENNGKCMYYTGLHWEIFFETYQFLEQFVIPSSSMPNIDQFFLTLVKLRFNLTFQFLADRAGYSKSQIIKIFWRWIDLMFYKLSHFIKGSDLEAARETLPTHFKEKFPRLTTIIDCFEIFIDRPKGFNARSATYSNYKKHTTVKFLIGCTPLGVVSFLSKAWGGRVSDVEVVRKSGFLDSKLHFPGDQILADRGFTVQEDMALSCSAELIIPSFTKGKRQLSAQEVETSRKIASVRIHIERIIGLIKNRFAILQGTLPVNVVKSVKDEALASEFVSVDKIVTTCAVLVNLGGGIVTENNNEVNG